MVKIDINEFQKKSARTLNYYEESEKGKALSNYSMGLAGESGELIDMLKKHIYHGHKLDIKEVKKEFGDILWYLAALATSLNINLDDVCIMNIKKLEKRYPGGFSQEDSINRVE